MDGMAEPMNKPVVALMGEFSAGKSTLANLLLGEGSSTVKVTATQLPPVWFSYGSGAPRVVDLEGNETEIPAEEMHSVSVSDTAFIRVYRETEILEIMDLIDMPGNSDPNMSADVWKRALHHATGVVWCTHANQAWRQSEAAVWEEISEDLAERSVLLLTRFDKILGDTNRSRVLRRVKAEAGDLFAGIYPVSLTEALAAGDDRQKWEASGADAFLHGLLDIVMAEPEPEEPEIVEEPVSVLPRRVAAKQGDASSRRPGQSDADGSADTGITAAE